MYEGPIRTLARDFGVELTTLSKRSPSALYQALLAGRSVMVWVGLSAAGFA